MATALFEPGNTIGKGRPKGAPNKTTQEMRDVMSAIHSKFLGQLEEDLNKMSPTNRWSILCKLAPFHMPTLSKNDNTNNTTGAVSIRVEYVDQGTKTLAELDQPMAPISLADRKIHLLENASDSTAK
jgi:hypothetical protein